VDQSGNLRFTANPVLKVNHPVNQGIPNTIVPNLVAAFESSHWAQYDIDAAKWVQATTAAPPLQFGKMPATPARRISETEVVAGAQ